VHQGFQQGMVQHALSVLGGGGAQNMPLIARRYQPRKRLRVATRAERCHLTLSRPHFIAQV
jgi:hypothetical protein